MARRPTTSDDRASPKEIGAVSMSPSTQTHIDRLVALLDHCTQAKDTADAIGEKFLSYLLAMAIQESRSAMRQSTPGK